MIYAILCNPGHNRVYFETSLKLAVSELNIVAHGLSAEYSNVQLQNICGIEYLTFETGKELSPADIKILSDLSFFYALFRMDAIGDEIYLKPISRIQNNFIDESMSTMLKYTGKTNEIFTRMMINVAYYSQKCGEEIRLLDPISGKGTTLYEGLVKGFSVYGIEIGSSVVNESYHFVRRFLENARYKFTYSSKKISGPDKAFSAVRHTFETAKTKEDFKNKNTKTIEFVAGNSLYANKYYKKNFFDMIVGDLPYGVVHGSVTRERQSSLTRNPAELLKACLPSWSAVLKPNGVLVIAWNCNVLPREEMVLLFEEQGLTVKNEDAYLQFEHRVDQSILRDIIVAQKKI